MTLCKIKIADTDPDDTVLILRMDGHATGFPDVCASISSLVCMLRGYLQNDPGVRVSREVVREGDVNIIAAGGREFRAVCRAFTIGLLQIEQEYPECIKMTEDF